MNPVHVPCPLNRQHGCGFSHARPTPPHYRHATAPHALGGAPRLGQSRVSSTAEGDKDTVDPLSHQPCSAPLYRIRELAAQSVYTSTTTAAQRDGGTTDRVRYSRGVCCVASNVSRRM